MCVTYFCRYFLLLHCISFHISASTPLQLIIEIRNQPILEFLQIHLAVHLLRGTAWRLRWDQHGTDNVDNAVPRNAILDRDVGEAVDLDRDEAAPARDVDGQALVLEQRGEIDVEETLGDVRCTKFHAGLGLGWLVGVVKGIRVQRLVGHDVVFQQRSEVFLAVFREQEGVDLWAEFLEGPVGGCEQCASGVGRFLDVFEETRLLEAELEGGELAGEERDDFCGGWWREEDGIDAVDDTVGSELMDRQYLDWRETSNTKSPEGHWHISVGRLALRGFLNVCFALALSNDVRDDSQTSASARGERY